MKKIISSLLLVITLLLAVCIFAVPAFADNTDNIESVASVANETEETAEDSATTSKAIAAAITIAVVASAGAISMGVTISKSNDSIARQPEVEGKIRTSMMLGLVFIETAIIYALIVAILIIFVL